MSTHKPVCSIVIRARNEQDHLGVLLQGIQRQTLSDWEVIIVDSGSTDGTLAVAAAYPTRILHIEPEAFTFGRSLNLGISACRSDRVVIVSAHVYPVYPDWLERLLAPFHDPQVALVYGRQAGHASTRFSEHQIFAKLFPPVSIPRQQHPFCNNANAAIRRDLWLQQAYDEELSGLEDLAWANWAISQGYRLSYAAEAHVVHLHRESPRQVYNRYRREAMALKRIRPGEHFSLRDCLRLFGGNVLSDAGYARKEGRFPGALVEIVWFRWMQFWGTYRGFALSGPLTSHLKQVFYYPRSSAMAHAELPARLPAIQYPESPPRLHGE